MKTTIKILVCITIMLFFNTSTFYALDFQSYTYTTSKQIEGITYELLDVSMDEKNISFKGWAYNSDSQHYENAKDVKIDILAIGDGVDKILLDSTITNEYDLTPIESYKGVRDCKFNEYYKDNLECNYEYKYVTFNAKTELENFNPKYEYEFYLFVESKNAGIKRYTKLYSPGINIKEEHGTKIYDFSSNIDESKVRVSVSQVLIRRAAGKHSAIYYANKHYYYYKENEIFNPKAKQFIDPITWYKVKFTPSLITFGNNMLGFAKDGTKTGYIPSNFVDYLGYGNSKLKIRIKSDVEILKVATHTIDTQQPNINLNLKFTDIEKDTKYQVEFIHSRGSEKHNFKTSSEYVELNIPIAANQIAGEKIIVIVSFIDGQQKDETNSIIIFDPFYAQKEEVEIKILKDQNVTQIKVPSGIEINEKRKETVYYETINLKYSPPIDNIQNGLGEYEQATGYYAGGAFSYFISIHIQDDYPYNKPDINISTPNVTIDCEVFDFKECRSKKIDLEKQGGLFILPKTYMSQNGDVHFEVQSDSIYSNGKNVFYTKPALVPGQHPFTITIPSYGINNNEYKIESYINVKGNLLGEGEGDYFYVRNVNKVNPMPDFISQAWNSSMDKLKELTNAPFNPKTKITLTSDAKKEINSWTKENYQVNINGNNKEFKHFIDDLIQRELLTITK